MWITRWLKVQEHIPRSMHAEMRILMNILLFIDVRHHINDSLLDALYSNIFQSSCECKLPLHISPFPSATMSSCTPKSVPLTSLIVWSNSVSLQTSSLYLLFTSFQVFWNTLRASQTRSTCRLSNWAILNPLPATPLHTLMIVQSTSRKLPSSAVMPFNQSTYSLRIRRGRDTAKDMKYGRINFSGWENAYTFMVSKIVVLVLALDERGGECDVARLRVGGFLG